MLKIHSFRYEDVLDLQIHLSGKMSNICFFQRLDITANGIYVYLRPLLDRNACETGISQYFLIQYVKEETIKQSPDIIK